MTTTITTALQADILSATMNALSDTFTMATMGPDQALGIQITGTFVGTVVFESTTDGVTWNSVVGYTPAGGSLSSLTAAGNATFPTGGYQAIRARVSAYTSGTIQVNTAANGGWLPIPASTVISGTAGNVDVLAGATGVGGTTKTLAVAISPFNSTILSHTLTSAATTNATLVKGSVGSIYSLILSNLSASVRYFKLFAKAAAPTVGTDIPVMVIAVPAGGNIIWASSDMSLRMATGISYCITGAIADTDTTAIAAGDVKVLINYA